MRGITIEEILEHAEKFERDLAELYAKISKDTNVAAVRLLADYLSRHRNRVNDALSKIPPEQMQRIVKIPLQYEPIIPGVHCFREIKLPAGATVQEMFDAAMKFDDCIAQMFRQIAHQPVHTDIKEFFENLQQLEENDQLELEKLQAMFNVHV